MFVGESNLGERRRSEDCSPPSWARFHFNLYYGPGSTFTFNSIMGKFHFHFLLNHGKVPLSLSANHVIVPLHKISDTKILIRVGELTATRWSQASSSGTRRPLPAFPFSDARWDPQCCQVVPLSFKICHLWKLQYQDVTAGHHSCAQHC